MEANAAHRGLALFSTFYEPRLEKAMKTCFRAMTLVLSAVLAAGVHAEEMDAEGFIKEWLMLAPIDISDGDGATSEIDKQQIPDEAKLAPKEGEKALVKGKEMAWKKIGAKEYYFDVNEILGDQHQGVAGYFVCYVESAEEQKDVKLLMGSNDQGKVYLNEKMAITYSEGRTIDKDQDSAVVTLNKGVNKLVFKVINDSNNWQGCMRFTDKDGKPLKGLKVKLAM
jgi:hypothetical protein